MAFVVTSALGVAAGMLVPQTSGLIQDLSRAAERGRAFGILGAIPGLTTAAGPVVGGLILTAFTGPDGWRCVVYVNARIGSTGWCSLPGSSQ